MCFSLVHFGLPGQFKGNFQQLMFHGPCSLLQMGGDVWVCLSLLYIAWFEKMNKMRSRDLLKAQVPPVT